MYFIVYESNASSNGDVFVHNTRPVGWTLPTYTLQLEKLVCFNGGGMHASYVIEVSTYKTVNVTCNPSPSLL